MFIEYSVRLKFGAGTLIGLLLSIVALDAAAQALAVYPSKPIRMIVPYPPAGPTDVVGRPMIEKLSANLGVAVVADWRPGGNTIIGTEAVAKSAPDGYTWLFTTFAHTTMPALSKSLPYSPLEDFVGAAMVATFPGVAVIPATLPATTIAEFVAHAKSAPGKLSYANAGIGSSTHLNTELFKMRAGIDMHAITYKGQAPAIPDLITGRIAFAFTSPALAVPHVKAGKLRALAVAAAKRSTLLPDVPTMAEAGYPDAQVTAWFAILVPAKTPRDIVQRIHREVARALAEPDVVQRAEAGGVTIEAPMAPEAIDAMMKSEVARGAKFMKEAGIEAQ
ncbi:MAG: tripartite tricarboxylate transporter substrate binding protein [Burkholderiales bacterium]